MNIQDFKTKLLPQGQTIKVIKGKAYLYQGNKCLGAASEDQVRVFKHIPTMRWLVNNEKRFLKSLQFLQDVKSGRTQL